LVLLAGLCGCFQSRSRECATGVICPADQVCAPRTAACVLPGQISACVDQREGDGCTYPGGSPHSSCTAGVCLPNCGNSRLEVPEECDDGNLLAGDGCGRTCLVERCGNAFIDLDETCDGTELGSASCAELHQGTPYGQVRCDADCQLVGDDCFGVTSVAAGFNNTCAVTTRGEVACWGDGRLGQLGVTEGSPACGGDCSPVPVLLPGLEDVVQVAVGYAHVCTRHGDGAVRCWGWNGTGQLGDAHWHGECQDYTGDTTHCWPFPVTVLLPGPATALTAGSAHACAIIEGGQAYCWGSNATGALGSATTPDQCGSSGCALQPQPVPGLVDAVSIAAGNHTCAARAGGAVWCWGWNHDGQLGDGLLQHTSCPDRDAGATDASCEPVAAYGLEDAVAVAAGRSHSCALRADGTVACWGWAGFIGSETTLTVDCTEGTSGCRPFPTQVTGLDDIVALDAGHDHTCAVRSDGAGFCWGWNLDGCLGDGTDDWRSTPIRPGGLGLISTFAAGYNHTCANLQSGSVWCWGSAEHGKLGDGTLGQRAVPAELGGP
jgi:cysteine-rich repeat protein